MNRTTQFLSGAALTAAGMYWFDRNSGKRRRARLRDRLVSLAIHLDEGMGVAARDLAHRGQGLAAWARSAFESKDVSDEVLVERVRARIGRVVSHPGAIKISAIEGGVILAGYVLAQEYAALLHAVHAVRGVKEVQDELAVYKTANGISALQGGRPRHPQAFELFQENWSPAARLLTGITGGALMLYALRHKGTAGSLLTAGTGGALLLRSATNIPLKRLAGTTGRRAIDIHKTIHVNAPVEEVFQALAHYENFPAFMRNVRSVQVHEDGHSHWVVAGPAGVPVEWDAVTTRLEPNRLIAWRTVNHSPVEHAGRIHFEPIENGAGTRLGIQMSYNPPAGALGHVVAKLFGADPKTELDEDLVRLKSFLETGKPARDAAARADTSISNSAVEDAGPISPEVVQRPH